MVRHWEIDQECARDTILSDHQGERTQLLAFSTLAHPPFVTTVPAMPAENPVDTILMEKERLP
jgi:hypothetical protein